jgi:NarL family two-component system response regulator LiaR
MHAQIVPDSPSPVRSRTDLPAEHGGHGPRARVYVVTSEASIYRRGLASVLAAETDLEWVGEAVNAQDACGGVLRHAPDLVLVDADLAARPGDDGQDLLTQLQALARTRWVVLSDQPGAAGGDGPAVVAKDAAVADLLAVVRSTLRAPLPRAADRPAAGTVRRTHGVGDDLTRRECELLELMARGHSNQEIAVQMAIAVPTVKFHVTNVLAKLHADNRTAAVLQALRLKIVQLD